jgi:hypothetical protein
MRNLAQLKCPFSPLLSAWKTTQFSAQHQHNPRIAFPPAGPAIWKERTAGSLCKNNQKKIGSEKHE